MNVLKFLPMLALLSFVMVSCGDDDDDEDEPAPTRSQLITSQSWSVVSLNVEPAIDLDGNGTQENNLIPFLQACDLDDFLKLNANGTFTEEEGASKCDPNNPQVIQSGVWIWNSDETRVVLTAGGQSTEYVVTALSSTALTTTETLVVQNVTYTFTTTYN